MVAVMGDTPSEVQSEILAARASGMQPDYITVRIQSQTNVDLTGRVINPNSRFAKWHGLPVTAKADRSYVFPVYAQLLRTPHALIVRAYDAIYVFRLADVSLSFGDMHSAIGIDTLPIVTANYFEKIAASNVSAGSFAAGNVREKEALCPDCLVLRQVPSVSTAIAANWNSKTDPWQNNPTYTPWHSGSSPIKPMFSNHPQPGPCGSMLSAGTVATSDGSCSGISSGGITQMSGPSFSGYRGGCITNPSNCVATIPLDQACNGSRSPNTPANGYGGHANAISNIFEVFLHENSTAYLIGWEYQDYQSQEYYQPNFTWDGSISAGAAALNVGGSVATSAPILSWNNNIYTDFQDALSAEGLVGKALPFPYDLMMPQASLNKVDCYSGSA